jgi:hypothetical protein
MLVSHLISSTGGFENRPPVFHLGSPFESKSMHRSRREQPLCSTTAFTTFVGVYGGR